MSVFEIGIDAAFTLRGVDASYCPIGDKPVPCKVIRGRPPMVADFGSPGFKLSTRSQVSALEVDVRRSEVAEPVRGARLVINESEVYEIADVGELDAEGYVWPLSLRKVP